MAELEDGKLYRLREHEFLEYPRLAMFDSSDAPVVGKPFRAFVNKSYGQRLPGNSWRWEKGGDADGWTSLPVQKWPTYTYTPTVADVGHRLRASVYYMYYMGHLGTRVRAITEPSEPVRSDLPK